MKSMRNYIGEQVKLEVSGKSRHKGVLVDIGSDIIVLFNGEDFLYIPFVHIQNFQLNTEENEEIKVTGEAPINKQSEEISLRKVLNNARGVFAEIFVTGNQSIHGYVTSVLNNYFVFYSPVYQTMFIPLNHLKWLIPYNQNQTPYKLTNQHFLVNPSNLTLARTFDEQLKKLVGKIVVFDLGGNAAKIGQLQMIENNFVHLISAREKVIYLNIHHIKTVHLPT
ncbi:DUF2642 domain-containing protein [Bacillus taeanensis]|uniref:DUF2642 domain-containing protein n=1 Tax=Bacillus taeanensis TaxID=273032 RepID=A0A366XUE2_9BACI|nr:DUF2642 domain-containing protein [Bacillus taeanensis]RBW69990.1 DUF2642 domain-containing protein [Bacillus taeanensis]